MFYFKKCFLSTKYKYLLRKKLNKYDDFNELTCLLKIDCSTLTWCQRR